MNKAYVSPYDTGDDWMLLVAVAAISVAIELARYLTYPDQYVGYWWAMTGLCITINVLYHRWSMPDTLAKVWVSAMLSEMPMPFLAHSLADLAFSVGVALVKFVTANMTGLTRPA